MKIMISLPLYVLFTYGNDVTLQNKELFSFLLSYFLLSHSLSLVRMHGRLLSECKECVVS